MSVMNALLKIEQLRAGYGAVEVLRGVDLEVMPGETVALLGSNGAGKKICRSNGRNNCTSNCAS